MKIKFTDDFKDFCRNCGIPFTFDLDGTYEVVRKDNLGVSILVEGEIEYLPNNGYTIVED